MAFGSILLAAIGIGLLIFLHELGHFMAARLAGVKVEVFSLGFGPRLCGVVWRGTDFRISAVPFGGFVMVAGQDPSDRRYPDAVSLHSKSVGQRALFWSGGVVMNVLFALVVFPIVFKAGVNFEAPVAGQIVPGTAAWEVDIKEGERIVEVAGKEIYSWQNMRMEVALNGNRPVQLLVEGLDGERRVITATPHFMKESGLYELGLTPAYDYSTVPIEVKADSPAAKAGLQSGDELVTLNGKPFAPGWRQGMAPLDVVVTRGEKTFECSLTPKEERSQPLIGVVSLTNRIAGIRSGCVLVERLGLQRNDRILAIDDVPFLSGKLSDFSVGPDDIRLQVLRDGKLKNLTQPATSAERAELSEHVALSGDFRLQLMPTEGGAAIAAGVRAGDWLQAINGVDVEDWEQLREIVKNSRSDKQSQARELKLRLLRPDPNNVVAGLEKPTGTVVEVTLRPKSTALADFGLVPLVSPVMVESKAESFGDAVRLGTICSLDLIKQLYVTLKRLITGEVGAKNLGGIIRISEVSYQAAQRGWTWLGYFLALLSLNLAFVNLLPIPVLDGGHLMFLLIEKVKGSPVSTKVFGYSQVIGLVFVLLLVLFVTYNDILRLL